MFNLAGRNDVLAIFDLGHATCRLVLTSADSKQFRVFSTPTEGYAKGKVTSISDFSAVISRLVRESSLSAAPYKAIVNITGPQTRTLVQTIQHRCGGTYRSADYQSIVETAVDSATSELDEVIDLIFLSARIDDRGLNVMGFGEQGRDINAQIMLATHPKIILADIVSGMNAGGVEVSEFRANVFGHARALQTLRPQAENCVLVDIGHSTTTGAVVIGGTINQVFCVPAGSDHITRDMMAGLNIPRIEAENLKLEAGLGLSQTDQTKPLHETMQRFLKPRVSEILSLVARSFAIYTKSLDGGILFCGNGSLLKGLSAFSQKTLGTPAPFRCQLSGTSADVFVGIARDTGCADIDSGWLSALSQLKTIVTELEARRLERDSRPLSKLRPLWTWLSELSR